MGKINIRRHIGDILVKKKIISAEQLQEALGILEQEPENSTRRLGQILFQDLDLNRHTIMKEIAEIYAFREVLDDSETVSEDVIEHIKKNVEELNSDVVDELVVLKAIPFHRTQNTITVAAADPSDPNIQGVIQKLNFKKTELVYCKYEFIEDVNRYSIQN